MLRNVQVLRALAALLVVVGHLQPLFMRMDPRLGLVALGRAGVDLFFVISGFVMVYTTNRTEPSPALFAYRRITRIVPLYFLVTLAVFGLTLVAPALLGATRPDPAWLIMSLAFIPFDKGDGTTNPLLPVGWSLNYEMAFYTVFALAMFAGQRWRYWTSGGLVIAASLPGFLAVPTAGPVAAFYTRPVVAEFVAGMALGAAFPWLGEIPRGPRAVVAVGALPAFVVVLLASGFASFEALRVSIAGTAAAVILGLAVALERGGAAVRSRPALLLGDASYSIYLTHLFVTQLAVAVAVRLNAGGAAAAVAIVAALSAAILGGILTYRLIELPVARVLKTFPANARTAARYGKGASSLPLRVDLPRAGDG
jgi:exopolysaccharide production protein ExoZ